MYLEVWYLLTYTSSPNNLCWFSNQRLGSHGILSRVICYDKCPPRSTVAVELQIIEQMVEKVALARSFAKHPSTMGVSIKYGCLHTTIYRKLWCFILFRTFRFVTQPLPMCYVLNKNISLEVLQYTQLTFSVDAVYFVAAFICLFFLLVFCLILLSSLQ